MGGAPSRETLVRDIVRESQTPPVDVRLSSTPEVILIPLIREYFPSSSSPLFRQFLSVRREPNICYYYCDAQHHPSDVEVNTNTSSDKELYNWYMSLSEQRLVETDSDLIALHRAGRVLTPVPCAVAFVYDAINVITAAVSQQQLLTAAAGDEPLGTGKSTRPKRGFKWKQKSVSATASSSLMSLENTARLHHHHNNLRVRIFGFIGDTRFCPSSLLPSTAVKHPMHYSIFLSRSAGGNHRTQVALLAAHTYVTQLTHLGIPCVSTTTTAASAAGVDPYACSDNDGDDGTAITHSPATAMVATEVGPEVSPLMSSAGLTVVRRCDSGDGVTLADQRGCVPVATPLAVRPLEYVVHRSDVPGLCFLRELRARIAADGASAHDTDGGETTAAANTSVLRPSCVAGSPSALPLGSAVSARRLNGDALRTSVDDEALRGSIAHEDFADFLCWGSEVYRHHLQSLVGGEAVKLRRLLATRNLAENQLCGTLFLSTQQPGRTSGAATQKTPCSLSSGGQWDTVPSLPLPDSVPLLEGDVWITPKDTVAEHLPGMWTPVMRGAVLRRVGLQWVQQRGEYAEDLLLSLCRNACQTSRRAEPLNPHWLLRKRAHVGSGVAVDAATVPALPEGLESGVLIWREEFAGQLVHYCTTPDFLKKWLQQGEDVVAMYTRLLPCTEKGVAAHAGALAPGPYFSTAPIPQQQYHITNVGSCGEFTLNSCSPAQRIKRTAPILSAGFFASSDNDDDEGDNTGRAAVQRTTKGSSLSSAQPAVVAASHTSSSSFCGSSFGALKHHSRTPNFAPGSMPLRVTVRMRTSQGGGGGGGSPSSLFVPVMQTSVTTTASAPSPHTLTMHSDYNGQRGRSLGDRRGVVSQFGTPTHARQPPRDWHQGLGGTRAHGTGEPRSVYEPVQTQRRETTPILIRHDSFPSFHHHQHLARSTPSGEPTSALASHSSSLCFQTPSVTPTTTSKMWIELFGSVGPRASLTGIRSESAEGTALLQGLHGKPCGSFAGSLSHSSAHSRSARVPIASASYSQHCAESDEEVILQSSSGGVRSAAGHGRYRWDWRGGGTGSGGVQRSPVGSPVGWRGTP